MHPQGEILESCWTKAVAQFGNYRSPRLQVPDPHMEVGTGPAATSSTAGAARWPAMKIPWGWPAGRGNRNSLGLRKKCFISDVGMSYRCQCTEERFCGISIQFNLCAAELSRAALCSCTRTGGLGCYWGAAVILERACFTSEGNEITVGGERLRFVRKL